VTSRERSVYFGTLWPAAAHANEWDVKDERQRKTVTRQCMAEIGGPATDSTTALGPDEVTALFVYLAHLGDYASLDKSAEWDRCKQDYQTYNRAKQADWHERALYGPGKNKLDRQRFGGATSASGGPLDSLDAGEVRRRHLTVASRHQKKQRREKGQNLASTPVAGTELARPVPAPHPRAGQPALSTEDAPF